MIFRWYSRGILSNRINNYLQQAHKVINIILLFSLTWHRLNTVVLLLQHTLTTEVGAHKNCTMAHEHADKPKEQHVDPWTAVAAEGENAIDYDKLISIFLKVLYRYYYTSCFCRTVWQSTHWSKFTGPNWKVNWKASSSFSA